MLARRSDGELSTAPACADVPGGYCATSPAQEDGDGAALVAATRGARPDPPGRRPRRDDAGRRWFYAPRGRPRRPRRAAPRGGVRTEREWGRRGRRARLADGTDVAARTPGSASAKLPVVGGGGGEEKSTRAARRDADGRRAMKRAACGFVNPKRRRRARPPRLRLRSEPKGGEGRGAGDANGSNDASGRGPRPLRRASPFPGVKPEPRPRRRRRRPARRLAHPPLGFRWVHASARRAADAAVSRRSCAHFVAATRRAARSPPGGRECDFILMNRRAPRR